MTRRLAQLLRGLAVAVFLVAWALLAHYGTAGDSSPDLSVLLGVSPIIAAVGLLLWRTRHPLLAGGGNLLLLGGLIWLWPTLRQNVPLVFFIQHLGTNLALATLFGRSLLGGGEALITQMARAIYHGKISERKRRYTQQATLAWALFFLANALVSAILWLLAPQSVWSVFANLLSLPLLIGMFVAEYLWRRCVLPPEERPSIAQVARAYRMHGKQIPPANPS
ncbi:hypothetical protein LZ012_02055 [Dechloromonas sp. XY25]|uniref:Transmembrane protein n=1 Tax=Dechloromonas hankyongensis TaxID=2908002 RepID=A0ABS9JXZ2_9RHOO|nr:hypothetical protein [Dechloromonas hankyongensis]MCG2575774.1 hypothetical protein [Dechloromonas hankyongensis]